ncbi:MAG: CHAT domain-containing protein [Saprospiraceae bacterium]|nr:CHAT domain-containing protein [Saprospiraceae bacterium]
MFKVDKTTLNEPVATIVLLEKKLMGLDQDVQFNQNYRSLDLLIAALSIVEDEKQVASADAFSTYLEHDDQILKNDVITGYISSIISEPFDKIKANTTYLHEYKDKCLHNQVNDPWLRRYFKLQGNVLRLNEISAEADFEYAKIYASATLSEVINEDYMPDCPSTASRLGFKIIMSKINSSDTLYLYAYFNLVLNLQKSRYLNEKYKSIRYLNLMVDGKPFPPSFYDFIPTQDCAYHYFSNVYFYDYLGNKDEVLNYLNLIHYHTEPDDCSYFRQLAVKEFINYYNQNGSQDDALELLRKSGQSSVCNPLIHRKDIKVQSAINALNIYMERCENGSGEFCRLADSVAVALNNHMDEVTFDHMHYSDYAATFAIKRLQILSSRAMADKTDLDELIEIFQTGKARQLMIHHELHKNNMVSADTLNALKKFEQEINNISSKINADKSDLVIGHKLHHDLLIKYEQKRDYQNSIKIIHHKSLSFPSTNGKTLQHKLKSNRAQLIDIMHNDQHLFVLHVRQDTFQLIKTDLTQELKDSLNEYKALIKNQYSDLNRITKCGRFLYLNLFKDLITEKYPHIYFSPTGIFSDFPLETLVTPDGKNIVDKFTTRYLFNMSMIGDQRDSVTFSDISMMSYTDQTTLTQRILPYAELIFAAQESNAISILYPGHRIRSGFQCNRESLGKAITSDIVHISTHAVSDPSNPLNNYLILRNGKKEDRFYGFEFAKMDIKAKLVVLNGCETQIGPEFKGEGTFSLARNLVDKGIPNVICTKWKINDQSAYLLMKSFYTNLKQRQGVEKALQHAILYLKEQPNFRHPYFWGGYGLF